MGQDRYSGFLPQKGEYKIRVYLMRSAARRLEVAVTDTKTINSSAAPQPISHDALIPGTNSHATGKILCGMAKGQPMMAPPILSPSLTTRRLHDYCNR
jgi:hypothetical protein